jgi:hypothetical protein
MPWHVESRGDRHCVVKTTTGEVKHCYSTKKEAVQYLRALYANTKGESKK